jgi:hypothetical protein
VSVGRWAADRIELGVRGAHQGPARDVDDRGELQVSGVYMFFFLISSIFFPTNETTAVAISLKIPEKDKENFRFPSSQLTWI